MSDVVLAIDQGTTNTKALCVDVTGEIVAQASAGVGVRHPEPGWVEQDAAGIWRSVRNVADTCLREIGASRVAGIALSTQRESAVVWNAGDGRPMGPVLSWQDTRTGADCAELRADPGAQRMVRERTGLPLDPMFSAPKFRRLLDMTGADDARVGTVDSWLLWNLTGGREHATEAGNASRTLLFSLQTLDWDDDLLDLFGVPRWALPQVRESNGSLGVTARDCGLPSGIPVLSVLADSHAALFGQNRADPGAVKATYGTGTSIMRQTATLQPADSGLASTLAWLTDRPTFAVEGNIRYSGACLEWMTRVLGLPDAAALADLALETDGSAGVAIIPAFAGLGAPYWDSDAVGIITGLMPGTSRAHLAHAAFESVAMQVCDVVEEMSRSPSVADAAGLPTLLADGGASRSTLLMQLQADLLGSDVVVSGRSELSALGAVSLAAERLGWPWPTRPTGAVTFRPSLDDEARRRRRASWSDGIARSRGQAVDGSHTVRKTMIGAERR